jgi:predicted outer membrane repeat protein
VKKRLSIRELSFLLFATFIGLGFALALPGLAGSWIQSGQIEAFANQDAPGGTRFYVSKSGDGTDGRTWKKAFTNVQDALYRAGSGDEIWVATGVYTPGPDVDDSFELIKGVQVYGGFRGGETQRSQRDWEANPTILSGDIDGDDKNTNGVVMTTTHINGANSYHVVFADGISEDPNATQAVLDGFTITAGDARLDSNPGGWGGGFYCDGHGEGVNCSPSLHNMVFSGNRSLNAGGAMFNAGYEGESSPDLKRVLFYGNSSMNAGAIENYGFLNGTSNPSLTDVTFIGNSASDRGGAMINFGHNGISSPELNKVTFQDNSAGNEGGAMFNDCTNSSGGPSLEDVVFSRNSADRGGAMYNNGWLGNCSPTFQQVSFTGNSAEFGGALFNYGIEGTSSPTLTNVLFSGNSAVSNGGAMYNDGTNGDSSPTFLHVTMSGNSAGLLGGGIFNNGISGGKSEPDLRNSIVWNNKDGLGAGSLGANIYNNSATSSLYHSLLQGAGASGGGWTSDPSYVDGGGNIDKDPRFLVPIDPSTAPTTNGDLRVKLRSPAVDAGKNSYSAGILTDLDGDPRFADGDNDRLLIVDMGAYERQNYTYLPGVVFR